MRLNLSAALICCAYSPLWAIPAQARFLQADPIGYDDQVNLYAYVQNDPLNLLDPSGERIVVAAHEVRVGADTGQYHMKLVIIPNNQKGYAEDSRFFTNNAGARVSTLGAGPVNGSLLRPLGNLVSTSNRPTDVNELGFVVAEISPGKGDTEDALISRLFQADANYRDNLDYDFLPSLSDGYNSNSYLTGLLQTVGIDRPPMPNQSIAPTPGADKPIPQDCFKREQQDCN